MTTQQKINKWMSSHPLRSAFVIEALHKYADNLIENEAQVKQDMTKGFIDGESWISIAKEVKRDLV